MNEKKRILPSNSSAISFTCVGSRDYYRRAWHLEKAMAPHSSTLAWKIPRTKEPGRLQSMGSLRIGHNSVTSLSLLCTGEGNGNPLQCSCLENPRDGGAWWAAVYGVAQSRTWLKRLSSSSRNQPPPHIDTHERKEGIALALVSNVALSPWKAQLPVVKWIFLEYYVNENSKT